MDIQQLNIKQKQFLQINMLVLNAAFQNKQ